MPKVSTEVVRVVWDDEEGVAFNIGPDPDGLGLVHISTRDAKSEQYFGIVSVRLSPEMAKEIGKALIATAHDGAA